MEFGLHKRDRRMVVLCCIIAMFLIVAGCVSDGVDINTGAQPAELTEAAEKQEKATDTIDKEAGKIIKKTKEEGSKKSAVKIKDANSELKQNVEVLEKEAEAKKSLLAEIVVLKKEVGDLKEKIKELNESFSTTQKIFVYGGLGIGMVLMALGIFIFVKSGLTAWEALIPGPALIISSLLTMWLISNFKWILLGTGILIVIGVVLKLFLFQDETIEETTKVGEQLKSKMKKLAGDIREFEWEEGTDIDQVQENLAQRVELILEQVFGDDTHGGLAERSQSKKVRGYITGKRKKVHRLWKPTIKA